MSIEQRRRRQKKKKREQTTKAREWLDTKEVGREVLFASKERLGSKKEGEIDHSLLIQGKMQLDLSLLDKILLLRFGKDH